MAIVGKRVLSDPRPRVMSAIRWRRARLSCAYAAPMIFVGALAFASAITPRYSQVSDTVSDLAAQGRPHALVMRAGIIACSLVITLFAWGLADLLPVARRALTNALFAGSGAGVLTGVFQIYPSGPNVRPNLEGELHNVCAMAMIAALLVSMMIMASMAKSSPAWRSLRRPSIGLAVLALTLGLLVLLGPHHVQGLMQRALYAAAFTWVVWAARTALTISQPGHA